MAQENSKQHVAVVGGQLKDVSPDFEKVYGYIQRSQQPPTTLMLTSLATNNKVENVKATIHLLKARQGEDNKKVIFT